DRLRIRASMRQRRQQDEPGHGDDQPQPLHGEREKQEGEDDEDQRTKAALGKIDRFPFESRQQAEDTDYESETGRKEAGTDAPDGPERQLRSEIGDEETENRDAEAEQNIGGGSPLRCVLHEKGFRALLKRDVQRAGTR